MGQLGCSELDAGQIGPVEVGSMQVRSGQLDPDHPDFPKARPEEVCAPQVDGGQTGGLEVRAGEVSPAQVERAESGAAPSDPAQLPSDEHDAGELGVVEEALACGGPFEELFRNP